jgi:hypothetical protein
MESSVKIVSVLAEIWGEGAHIWPPPTPDFWGKIKLKKQGKIPNTKTKKLKK